MDQNSSSSTPNPNQTTNPLTDANQPIQAPAQQYITPQAEPDIPQVSDPATFQSQPTDPSTITTDNSPQKANYVEDIGYSLVSLLDQINSDEKLIQVVAHEMRLDTNKVKSILAPLLDKIDQEQITLEELALITAASIVDEPPEIT